MTVFGDSLYLYGGYYREPDDEDKEIERAKVHTDMWVLNLKDWRWEKAARQGMAPGEGPCLVGRLVPCA